MATTSAKKKATVAKETPVVVKRGGSLDRLRNRAAATQTTVMREIEIPLNKIRFDPTQPRKAFHTIDGRVAEKDQLYIDELAKSVKENGLIQAITVKEMDDGNYLVVVGECRTRAHMQLGLPTVRAIVRNDLTNHALRLLYQLSENVNRQDLTDDELAESIRQLMKGDVDNDMPPMTQVQIADRLGKSEGWVSRFVKFGDEELQRVWVKSGIADTVEKLYRLSILPKPLQVDIQRRVELPVGDPERLEKPLNRNVIDDLAREAKAEKLRVKEPVVPPRTGLSLVPGAPGGEGGVVTGDHGVSSGEFPPEGGVATNDVLGQAFQAAALDGQTGSTATVAANNAGKPAGSIETGGYQLSPEAREKLLGGVSSAAAGEAGKGSREVIQPPVNCRILVSNLEALLDVLKSDETMLGSLRDVRCELSLPGGLAKLVANELMGVIVDDRELPAILQTELAKLK